MQLKKLKEIQIGRTTFNIIWDKDSYGGSFSFPDKELMIGTKSKCDKEIFDILVHELSEALHCDLYTRFYGHNQEEDYLFIMDHKQFTVHNTLLAQLILKFIK